MSTDYWYLACAVSELEGDVGTCNIMGEDIALFRLADGEIVAFSDRCCHRSLPLSLGHVDGCRVVCGYHGWSYDRSGECVRIPSQCATDKPPHSARVQTYPVTVQNRLIWVFLGEPERASNNAPANIPELDDGRFQIYNYTIEADLEAANESLLDPYHVDYVHRASIRDLQGSLKGQQPDFHVTHFSDGFEGWYERASSKATLMNTVGSRVFGWDSDKIVHSYCYNYPNLQRVWIKGSGPTLLIVQHVTAVDEDRLRITNFAAWEPMFKRVPGVDRYLVSIGMRKFATKVVNEDIAVLIAQKKRLRDGVRGRQIHVREEEISLAFRRLWREKRTGTGPSPREKAGLLPRERQTGSKLASASAVQN